MNHSSLKPEDFLHFIELTPFTKRWELLGLDAESDLTALQWSIMAGPKVGPVIKGTRGLRKLRFSPPTWKVGKRGATRVLYVYFEEFFICLLCFVYGKGELDTISETTKAQLNQVIGEIANELRRIYKE